MGSGRIDDNAGVRFPPPMLYVAFLALGIVANIWYPIHLFPSALARALGGAILVGGVALGPIWGIRTLHVAGTTVRPDKSTTKLVSSGPFRFSRNPLYLSLTLIYAGIALIANSIWALVLLIPINFIMSRFVIRREEEYLARTFGGEYERYKMNVRRWI